MPIENDKPAEQCRIESLEELVKKAADNDAKVRMHSAISLMHLEDQRAVPTIHHLLNDTSVKVRALSALALGQYQASEARESLIEHLQNDKSGDVRAQCAYALSQIGNAEAHLIRALSDPDWHVKTSAAVALGLDRNVNAIEPLTELLDDLNWYVRYFASMALMDIGTVGPNVVTCLEELRNIPEAVDTIASYAEADISMAVFEKHDDVMDDFDFETEDILGFLRKKYGEQEVPFPPSDPLGDLIEKARSMLNCGTSGQ